MVYIGQAAEIDPLQMEESYRIYGDLIKALATDGVTFKDARDMVRPLCDDIKKLGKDRTNPHLLFLAKQKEIFIER
jgi:hypothetical protein